jgi:hypothetical protein
MAPVGADGVEVKTASLGRVEIGFLGGPFGIREVHGAAIVAERQRRIVAARQPSRDQVAGLEGPARILQNEHPAACYVAIVVEIAQVLVQHLRHEPVAFHEYQRLAGQQRILEGQVPRGPAQPGVERQTLLGGHVVHGVDGDVQTAQGGRLRFQFRFRQRSFQIRQQTLRSLQCLANRLGRIGRPVPTPLLSNPICLDLAGQGILAAETGGCGAQVAAEKTCADQQCHHLDLAFGHSRDRIARSGVPQERDSMRAKIAHQCWAGGQPAPVEEQRKSKGGRAKGRAKGHSFL